MRKYAETERLILREILMSDTEGMFRLDSDLEVHKYLGKKPVISKQQTIEVINFIRQQYIDNGIGRWAIIDKKTNKFVGWTGLKFEKEMTNKHINYYDLGYRLIKEYWGQGIATEAAFASLEYAFDKLPAEVVFAMADIDNEGSNNVLKKVGFKLIEVFDLAGVKHNWYKVERKEFRTLFL